MLKKIKNGVEKPQNIREFILNVSNFMLHRNLNL